MRAPWSGGEVFDEHLVSHLRRTFGRLQTLLVLLLVLLPLLLTHEAVEHITIVHGGSLLELTFALRRMPEGSQSKKCNGTCL